MHARVLVPGQVAAQISIKNESSDDCQEPETDFAWAYGKIKVPIVNEEEEGRATAMSPCDTELQRGNM